MDAPNAPELILEDQVGTSYVAMYKAQQGGIMTVSIDTPTLALLYHDRPAARLEVQDINASKIHRVDLMDFCDGLPYGRFTGTIQSPAPEKQVMRTTLSTEEIAEFVQRFSPIIIQNRILQGYVPSHLKAFDVLKLRSF
ncbi:MAG: hypothetical protein AABY13_00745 [Nanoarchaeota archaeon]